MERRFKVEAVEFECLDEDWYDEPFFAPWISDEVVVLIQDPERRVMTFSRIFEDVDTGDVTSFASTENCILPISGLTGQEDTLLVASHRAWACSSAGIAGPFQFTIAMYEEDSGFFHDCFHDFPFGGCSFDAVQGYPGDNDELIGRRTLAFTAEELAAAMPNVNDTLVETIKLGPCHEQEGCVDTPVLPSGPEYAFTYRLTRLPDVTVEPVLDPNP